VSTFVNFSTKRVNEQLISTSTKWLMIGRVTQTHTTAVVLRGKAAAFNVDGATANVKMNTTHMRHATQLSSRWTVCTRDIHQLQPHIHTYTHTYTVL